jgi:DNA primase
VEGKLAYLYEHGVKLRNSEGATNRFRWVIGNAAFPWRWHIAARPEVKEVFLCESESDAVALIAAGLENLYPRNGTPPSAVIAIPGAGNFAEGWAKLFTGKRVTICFDWDGKSDAYLTKTARLLSRYASRVATLTHAQQ